jgi:hypothetical protein
MTRLLRVRPSPSSIRFAVRLLVVVGFGSLLWLIVALRQTEGPPTERATAHEAVRPASAAPPPDASATAQAPAARLPPQKPLARAAPEVLAMDPLGPSDAIVDDEFVYWISRNENYIGNKKSRVMRAPKSGGAATTLAEAGWIEFLAVDEAGVYWTARERDFSRRDGAIRRVSKRGGRPTTLAAHRDGPGPITAGGGLLYWLENRGSGKRGHQARAIMTARTTGAPRVRQLNATVLVDTLRLWLDHERLYFSGIDGLTSEEEAHLIHPPVTPGAMSGRIGFYELRDGRVVAEPYDPNLCGDKVPCGPVTAATSGGGRTVWGITSGAIMTIAPSTDEPVVLALGPERPTGVALDGRYVYWVAVVEKNNPEKGQLLRVALDGGAPEVLATGLVWPWGIAVDREHIYWAEWLSGKVARIAKP